MPSRRDQVRMTPDEVDAFLAAGRTMNVATLGPTGHPHLVAMWYGFVDGQLAFWTFGKSQKILNLRRDPRITALVEDGDEYAKLRGVELVGTGEVVSDPDLIVSVGVSVAERNIGPVTDDVRPFIEAQARKRLAVLLHVEHTVSWDHTKLAGAY